MYNSIKDKKESGNKPNQVDERLLQQKTLHFWGKILRKILENGKILHSHGLLELIGCQTPLYQELLTNLMQN